MTLTVALRSSECLLALVLLQQALEHLGTARDERRLHACIALFAVLLMTGAAPLWAECVLLVLTVLRLLRFDGPYNGGADRLTYLILICLTLARLAPTPQWQELAFGYLALQLCLSYAMSGWVKLVNPAWRSGQALRDVFAWSAYPQSEQLRLWAEHPRTMFIMSWSVIGFELAFPFALALGHWLWLALALAASFHLANAWLFGLNRFVWVWLAGYPALLWLQERLFPLASQ